MLQWTREALRARGRSLGEENRTATAAAHALMRSSGGPRQSDRGEVPPRSALHTRTQYTDYVWGALGRRRQWGREGQGADEVDSSVNNRGDSIEESRRGRQGHVHNVTM
eukprot:CAMPEP_0196666204 /NCGR_PEP_ID=MMETSP1086-20130531/64246_1 /TAXON_ID=77921 /ORGANISM="Cyanoptyche  gloeocystis , Strain SAG4.97" /LENGTH=108 /DNA_ID=CAMNT_0042003321 /DNA_START=13 /DNA_END=336 /DNA_ORIENTATION=-